MKKEFNAKIEYILKDDDTKIHKYEDTYRMDENYFYGIDHMKDYIASDLIGIAGYGNIIERSWITIDEIK